MNSFYFLSRLEITIWILAVFVMSWRHRAEIQGIK